LAAAATGSDPGIAKLPEPSVAALADRRLEGRLAESRGPDASGKPDVNEQGRAHAAGALDGVDRANEFLGVAALKAILASRNERVVIRRYR
jgi:hypothetical protein